MLHAGQLTVKGAGLLFAPGDSLAARQTEKWFTMMPVRSRRPPFSPTNRLYAWLTATRVPF